MQETIRMEKKLMKCLIFIKHVELCLDDSLWIEMTNLWPKIYVLVVYIAVQTLSGESQTRRERRLNETNLHNIEYFEDFMMI